MSRQVFMRLTLLAKVLSKSSFVGQYWVSAQLSSWLKNIMNSIPFFAGYSSIAKFSFKWEIIAPNLNFLLLSRLINIWHSRLGFIKYDERNNKSCIILKEASSQVIQLYIFVFKANY